MVYAGDAFQLTKGFKSYVSKPEITDLAPNFLVKASRNVLIDYASRIVSRNGYALYGAANSGGSGIKSSYDWDCSTGKQFPIRIYDGRYEFYWNSAWNLLKSGFASSYMQFAALWDNTEKIDVLMSVVGDTNTYKWSGAVAKIASATAVSITKQGVLSAKVTIAFVAGTPGSVAATITDSASGFLTAGFAAGDTLYVTGSTNNSRNFTIGSVTADTITLIMSDVLVSEAAGPAITVHNGEPTWATSRFLTAGTRKLVYNGTEYAYTGGEASDTLTGLVGFPAASTGDPVWQALITLANPGAINANFKQDLVGVEQNQLVLASTKSREVYGSSTTDYTNFTLTSPRAPGDPFKVTMDNNVTCIIPIDNPDQATASLMLGGGTSEFFRLKFVLSQDNTNEIVRVVRLKTAAGSGLISPSAIGAIKNATAYVSREPALEMLGQVENLDGKTNVPLSDLIKDDFDSYDFTGAHLKYWKRAIYIAVPVHGIILIFDMMRQLWQPPQTIPVSRLAIIGDWLYGHSSVTNETYKLFTGTDDNGIFIPQVARFAYNNGGRRDQLKNLSTYWTDGYITASAELDMNLYYGFDGSTKKKSFTILGTDTDITTSLDANPLGNEDPGDVPLGGSPFDPVSGLPGSGTPLLRFWQEDTADLEDYIEQFVEYTMNTLGGQFALVAHGSNQWIADTTPISHKK